MTGISTDNNFKSFLKVDLFTPAFYSKDLKISVTRLRHTHRRSLPDRPIVTDLDILVLLTCARILRNTVYGPTHRGEILG